MTNLNNIKEIKLSRTDNNQIIFLEKQKFLEKIKRFFIIDAKQKKIRGGHAHKKAFQVIVCLDKFCEFNLFDGKNTMQIHLRKLQEAIYIPPMIWLCNLRVQKKCKIIVFTDQLFNEKEYIRDLSEYSKFKKIKSNR